ncbi:hypothetical protein BC835DRAFT_1422660 [Cytidiella melzeri]|nr:hypothetical protein BC835DRAFT_1422660 [Cytidiella melzeri]
MQHLLEGDEDIIFEPRLTAVYVTIHQQTEQVTLRDYTCTHLPSTDLRPSNDMRAASNTDTQSGDGQASSQGSAKDVEEPQFDESIFDSQESIHLAPTLSTKTAETDNQSVREEITDGEETTQAVQGTNYNDTHIKGYTWVKMTLGKMWEWIPSFRPPMTQYLQGQLDIKRTHNLGSPTWDIINKPERILHRDARVVILTPENPSPNHVLRILGAVGSINGRLVIAAKSTKGKQNVLIVVNNEDYSPPCGTKLVRHLPAWLYRNYNNNLGEIKRSEEEERANRVSTQTWAE